MNIFFVIPKFIAGACHGELSADYYNLFLGSEPVRNEAELFDYCGIGIKFGIEEMNRKLLAEIDEQKPDIVFIVLHTNEIFPETVDRIKAKTICLGFFHDDKWRKDYVKYWASHFSYILCTDPDGEKRFAAMGISNALSFPQGCNPEVYVTNNNVKDIDVSFVGAYHPHRAWLIDRIRRSGVDVQVYGPGWQGNGFTSALCGKASVVARRFGLGHKAVSDDVITFSNMVEIFGRSKINLNLSNSTNWDARYLVSSPLALWNTLRSKKYRDGIKLRCFEIGASGGFQLSYYEEGLERYYEIGSELAIFINPDDMIDKVKYYLQGGNDDERDIIAHRGLSRTIKDHTIAERFRYIFNKMGVSKSDS